MTLLEKGLQHLAYEPAQHTGLALTRLVFVLARKAALIAMFIAVSLKSAVTLFVCLDDAVATERLCAVLEAVVFTVQLIQHCIQHLQKHRNTRLATTQNTRVSTDAH